MSRAPVYIAAPFAAANPMERSWNASRANGLAKLAIRRGYAPLVVHPAILAGCYGSDEVEADRAAGIECDIVLVELVARHPQGQLWILTRPDGSLSTGVQAELDAWTGVHRGERTVWRRSWAQLVHDFVEYGMLGDWLGRASGTEIEGYRAFVASHVPKLGLDDLNLLFNQ